MNTVTLYIETPAGQQTVSLETEISIGRTNQAQLVLNDQTLSRVHATIFREAGDIWLMDENSSNGSFVNGERVVRDRKLRDGDEIQLGSHTRIYVEIQQSSSAYTQQPLAETMPGKSFQSPPSSTAGAPVNQSTIQPPPTVANDNKPGSIPLIPLIGGASAFFIIIFAAIAFFILRSHDNPAVVSSNKSGGDSNKTTSVLAKIDTQMTIPIRVIDPLGGQDPEDLDDFLSSWGNEEEPLKEEDIEQLNISSTSADGKQARTDLNVSPDFWKKQLDLSLSRGRGSATLGTPEIYGKGGFAKQLAKGAQLQSRGYKVPLDFGDLAGLRLRGELVEMPIATQTYVLDVGGSATEKEFTEFSYDQGDLPLAQTSEKYQNLQKLAANFDGIKYDLNNPQDRKKMRMRLLRMFNPNSKKLFEQITAAYYEKFKVPLRVTSMMRSMDYQRALNSVNGNSYRVRPGTVPPHTTGCTFDVGRNNLPTDAQNFLIETLSALERQGKIDTLIEGNVNACLHTMIYPDGVAPN